MNTTRLRYLYFPTDQLPCSGEDAVQRPIPLPHRHHPRVQQPAQRQEQGARAELDGHHRQHQPVSVGLIGPLSQLTAAAQETRLSLTTQLTRSAGSSTLH